MNELLFINHQAKLSVIPDSVTLKLGGVDVRFSKSKIDLYDVIDAYNKLQSVMIQMTR